MTAQPARPFLPTDRSPAAVMRPAIRRLAAEALCRLDSSLTMQRAAAHLFGEEEGGRVAKAAVSPLSLTSTPTLAGSGEVANFLAYVSPRSAAAELLALVPKVDMTGQATVLLPRWSTPFAEAPWIAEGAPIPVLSAALEELTLGPPRKLAAIAAMTSELSEATGAFTEMVIAEALKDAAGRALNSALFSTAAATSIRPAGLLNGITPTTAATGGGINAAASDVGALAGAIASSGGGRDIIYIAHPKQAASLRIHAAGFVVISSPSLPSGTVIALERQGLVAGFDATPNISIVKDATLHLENSAPLQLVTGAQGEGVVASPARSMFQTNSLAIRCVMKAAWVRRPGLVAVVNSVTW